MKVGFKPFAAALGAILILISPSLVWFTERISVFGEPYGSVSIKGSEHGQVNELLSLGGQSVWASGELATILGIVILLTIAGAIFIPHRAKLLSSIAGLSHELIKQNLWLSFRELADMGEVRIGQC